mmetsp:Transcript_18422/g.35043  ORF Transcript_18422/g.35043 Transcript_18422/m.35043 type:complete len:394 (+) Transcript_18422:132-1313(+)
METTYKTSSARKDNWIQGAMFSTFANQWSRMIHVSNSDDGLCFAGHPVMSLILVYIWRTLLARSQGNEKRVTDWLRRILLTTFSVGIHADLLYLNSMTHQVLWGEVIRGLLIIGFCHYKLQEHYPQSELASKTYFHGMLLLHGLTSCTSDNLQPMVPLVLARGLGMFLKTSSCAREAWTYRAALTTRVLESVTWAMYHTLHPISTAVSRKPNQPQETQGRSSSARILEACDLLEARNPRPASKLVTHTFEAVKTAHLHGMVGRRSWPSTRAAQPVRNVAIPIIVGRPREGVVVVRRSRRAGAGANAAARHVQTGAQFLASPSVGRASSMPCTPPAAPAESHKSPTSISNNISSPRRHASLGLGAGLGAGELLTKQSIKACRESYDRDCRVFQL